MKTFRDYINEATEERIRVTNADSSGNIGFPSSKEQSWVGDYIGNVLVLKNQIERNLFEPAQEVKKEFGSKQVYNLWSPKTESWTVVKIDAAKETMAFLDKEKYDDGKIAWERPFKFVYLTLVNVKNSKDSKFWKYQ